MGFHLWGGVLPDGPIPQGADIVQCIIEHPVAKCPHRLPVIRVKGLFNIVGHGTASFLVRLSPLTVIGKIREYLL